MVKLIGRAQGLDVEFQRGIDHAFRGMRKCLEFGIMRGDQSRASGFKQVSEDRARQCRAFLRVGARAKFIEDDQRALIDLFQDADDVGDVTAERAERLLDGLLIADIGIDRVEARQLRAALGGDVQSALRHEGQQANRFERNRFAARVRTGDDNGACAGLGINIDGHNGLRIEQRMAGMHQA